jgi:hypothetical protein
MGILKKLPGGVRYPSHKEWQLLKKLPKWWLLGTLVFISPIANTWYQQGNLLTQNLERTSMFLGLLFTFWFIIGAMTIGLIVIIIMKGPGYVADPYFLPKEDKSLENPPPKS